MPSFLVSFAMSLLNARWCLVIFPASFPGWKDTGLSLPTAAERRSCKWPRRWAGSCLRVGGNRLPLSRFSPRKVAAVKANYTLAPRRTTIIKPTDPSHFIISELCCEVFVRRFLLSVLCFLCNRILCDRLFTISSPATSASSQGCKGVIVDSEILPPVETEGRRGGEGGSQCVTRQFCPHVIPAESRFTMIKLMLGNGSLYSLRPVSYLRILSVRISLSRPWTNHSSLQKHLTLTGSDCQLPRLFSLSVYQSIFTCVSFIFFQAGQANSPKNALRLIPRRRFLTSLIEKMY